MPAPAGHNFPAPAASLADIQAALNSAVAQYAGLRRAVEAAKATDPRAFAALRETLGRIGELLGRLPRAADQPAPALVPRDFPAWTETTDKGQLFDAFAAIEWAQERLARERWARRPLVAAYRSGRLRRPLRLAAAGLALGLLLAWAGLYVRGKVEDAIFIQLVADSNMPPGLMDVRGLDDIEVAAGRTPWRWTLGPVTQIAFMAPEKVPLRLELVLNNSWPGQLLSIIHNDTTVLWQSFLPPQSETDPGMPLVLGFNARPGSNSLTLAVTAWNTATDLPPPHDPRPLGIRLLRLDLTQDNLAGCLKARRLEHRRQPR